MPLCFKDFFLEDIKIIIFFHFCKWTQPLIHQLSPLLQLYLLLVRQALHFHLKTRREESFWGSAAVIYGQGGNGVTGSYNWGAEKWDVDGKYTCCHNWACPAQPWQGRCCSPSGWWEGWSRECRVDMEVPTERGVLMLTSPRQGGCGPAQSRGCQTASPDVPHRQALMPLVAYG